MDPVHTKVEVLDADGSTWVRMAGEPIVAPPPTRGDAR